jgi:lipopolysaccharide transport system ATP-binding protein
MQMRLGFAVAAHLEPDILIVDEVLAVGDLEFQNRCLGKMQSVATQGRTVLFVSHNMGAVANLCTSALWLDAGRMVTQGPVAETIAAYIQSVGGARDNDVSRWTHKGTGEARFLDGQPVDADGSPRTTFAMGESVVVELEMEVCRTLPVHQLAVVIKRAESGLPVLHLLSDDSGAVFRNLAVGKHRFSFELPNCLLYPGVYTVTLVAHSAGNVLDRVENALGFSMVQSGAVGRTTAFRSHLGVFHSPSIWRQM